ncbi:glycosyltransferase [Dietzia aurantiaca]|uniref:glycosyltransferase n=1 Tax=Dietzia aurantiaca TaxID=983873 RepID=UPI0027E31926|nr:glycosyltransferase [Dietzia aurantiaca]MCD2261756.1 glycosyltransferase [Dietzia aurantiaca]
MVGARGANRHCHVHDPSRRGRFLGHVERSQVRDRWAVAVSASVPPEAGLLGVLECMAAGRPVVATDHGGAAEYLREGISVLVAPRDPDELANALAELFADPARRELMAGALTPATGWQRLPESARCREMTNAPG